MRVEIIKPCRLAPVGAVLEVHVGVAETLVTTGVGRAIDSFPPPPVAAQRIQAPQTRPAPATANNNSSVIRRAATIRKS